MQYILSEQEYDDLVKAKKRAEDAVRERLQEACTLAAKHTPIVSNWAPEMVPAPWGCVLDEESDPGYCDDCPVNGICPYDGKRFSK